MNNYSSFLDAPGPNNINPNMPRQAPSPSPSAAAAAQHAAQQNGMAQMNGQGNGVPMVNGLPSGGQQTDMNHLWSVVQQLSQVLEENRAQTRGIVEGVREVQQRAVEEGAVNGLNGVNLREVNGELNAASTRAEIQNLSSQLTTAQSTISSLTASNTSLTNLITDYENALTLLLDKLRPYAYNQTQNMLALHKHYQSLLETERATSMQIRLEHAEWQAGLGRVAEYARLALKVQSEGEVPYKREMKELKEENRVLRRLAGWEEKEDDSSDEEDENRSEGMQ